jgi:hypothetical protein
MLNVIEGVVAPMGREPSRWSGSELESFVEALQNPPCVLATGDGTGLSAEYPYGSATSLLRVHADEKNPRMGNGCLILYTLPTREDETTAENALELNGREVTSFTRAPFLGSWCPAEQGLTFVSFFPNAFHRDGLLTNMLTGAVLRARWGCQDCALPYQRG